jgi:hypothetical protein
MPQRRASSATLRESSIPIPLREVSVDDVIKQFLDLFDHLVLRSNTPDCGLTKYRYCLMNAESRI